MKSKEITFPERE